MKRKWTAAFFKNSWIWGKPEGLSDRPEKFLEFLNNTKGIQYISATGIIRINTLDEDDAILLVGFLRNPPLILREYTKSRTN